MFHVEHIDIKKSKLSKINDYFYYIKKDTHINKVLKLLTSIPDLIPLINVVSTTIYIKIKIKSIDKNKTNICLFYFVKTLFLKNM